MTLTTKILIFLAVVFAIATAGFVIYKQHEILAKQDAIEKQIVAQKELSDNVTRSSSQYVTKEDLEKFAKDSNVDLKAIKEDLSKLNASLVAVNVATIHSQGQQETSIPSSSVKPGDNPNPPTSPEQDPFDYQKNEQILHLDEKFSNVQVPFGDIGFSAWKDKPWSLNISSREYMSTTVLGMDENQKHYAYNKFIVKVNDKEYELKITKSVFQEEYPESKFSFWNPRLFLTAGGAINLSNAPIKGSANLGITLGIMSYGKFKTNPAISILQAGAVYETGTNRPAVIINPVNFNIGSLFPAGLVNNTFVGPSLQLDTSGNIFTGANLSVGF